MLLAWCFISLVFAGGCLNGTFARKSASFNPRKCKAYYRIKGGPKTEEGITTYYFGRSCHDLLQYVEDETIDNLPDPPRDIAVNVSCDNRSADIVWVPRIGDGTARNMNGFLLQAKQVNLQDFNSTFFCYGIFVDETISSILLSESIDVPEFEFSCFEIAPNATLEASMWSISSQDRSLCQSLHNCSYRVDRYSMAKFDMTPIDEDKWCRLDCSCWKPDWRLMVVTDEYGQCQGLQLHLDNVIWSLASLHLFIVHNETGGVVVDTIFEHKTFGSSKNLTLVTGLLQKSGRYYAKLETVCKDQRPSTCRGIKNFVSDCVSIFCDIPQPPGIPHDPTWTLLIVCVVTLSAVFLTLCFRFQGPIRVYFERWNPVSNVSELSANNVNSESNASDSLLDKIAANISEGTSNADRCSVEISNPRNPIVVAFLFHTSQENEVDKVTAMRDHISYFGVQTLIPRHHELFKNIYDTAEYLAKEATDFVVIWPKKLFSLYNAFLKLNDNGERHDAILQETIHGALSCCILQYLLQGRRNEFHVHIFVEDLSQKQNSLPDFIEIMEKQKHVFTYVKTDRDDLQRFVLKLWGAGQIDPEVQKKIETFISILAS